MQGSLFVRRAVKRYYTCSRKELMKCAELKIISVLLFATAACMAETGKENELDLKTADLGEIDRQLNNPLTSIWSLTFQNNTSVKTGDAIDGKEYSNNLFFQPFLPFEVGPQKQYMLTLRPVFPLVTQPTFDATDPRNSSGHETGLGDIQLLTLAGPNQGRGLVWGAGATFKFPTATDDVLGSGKYQAGPAGMLFYMGKPWVGGILAQHWSSFAGEDDRADTSQSDIQYIIRRSIPGAMSIGMGPTITYDWKADSNNALTLPVGLGLTKTTRWGKTPVKLRAEIHYSIIKPEDYGTEWNFRLQITPVINSPMKK
jgi:hypothetical protein